MLAAVSFLSASFCALTYTYQLVQYSICSLEDQTERAQCIVIHLWALDMSAFYFFHLAFTSCNAAVLVAAFVYVKAGFRIAMALIAGVIIVLGVVFRVIFLMAFDIPPDKIHGSKGS